MTSNGKTHNARGHAPLPPPSLRPPDTIACRIIIQTYCNAPGYNNYNDNKNNNNSTPYSLSDRTIQSAHARTHARTDREREREGRGAPAHTITLYTTYSPNSSSTDYKDRPKRRRENSCARGETRRVYCLGKRNVLRLDLKESREGFCRRGRGRSFLVDGPKTVKAREPTVESLIHG